MPNKLIAIVNDKIGAGIAMNALAHCSLAFGKAFCNEDLSFNMYQDKEQKFAWSVSGIPFIILKGSSSEIRKALFQAKEQNIWQVGFTDSMAFCGTQDEQIHNTQQKTIEEFIYYAAVLYGEAEQIKTITKRLSLFK